MGGYTGLAKLGTKRWESRSYRGGVVHAGGERPPVEETRFLCPECREHFPVEDDCPRCMRPVLDRTVAMPVVGGPARVSLLAKTGSPAMYLLGILAVALPLAWIPLVEYFEGQRTGSILSVLGIAAAITFGVPMLYAVISSALDRRAAVLAQERARRAMLAVPCVRIADLPEETEAPMRIRGRVRFESSERDVHVRVCDDTGAVTLPATLHLRARPVDPSSGPIDAVRDGDEVALLFRGRRVACAGEGYRRSESELELDATVPVDIWVERRGG